MDSTGVAIFDKIAAQKVTDLPRLAPALADGVKPKKIKNMPITAVFFVTEDPPLRAWASGPFFSLRYTA